MISADMIGSLAGMCTTIAFVPQVIKVVKTKSTKDISLSMFSIFSFGVLLWIFFGFITSSNPIIISNVIILLLSGIILAYKIIFK